MRSNEILQTLRSNDVAKGIGRSVAAATLIFSLQACTSSESQTNLSPMPTAIGLSLPERGEKIIELPNTPAVLVKPIAEPGFTGATAEKLYKQLQTEAKSRDEQLAAIRDNVALVLGMGNTMGTATMIDENGTYLTAAHLFTTDLEGKDFPNASTQVVHLKSGAQTNIQTLLVNPNRDIALFSAPTGKPSKPIPGIHFAAVEPTQGMPVWLSGLQIQNGRFVLQLAAGTVNRNLERIAPFPLRDTIFLDGIRDFPGASGGAMVDAKGNIVGVVNGPAQRDNIQTYRYTQITALEAVFPMDPRQLPY